MFFRNEKADTQCELTSALISFLDSADAKYIHAFETRSARYMLGYFTNDCIVSMGKWITTKASSRFFAERRMRQTTWDLVEAGNPFVVRKTCSFKSVHWTLSRTMKVSDDYTELWTVEKNGNEYLVAAVNLETQEYGSII